MADAVTLTTRAYPPLPETIPDDARRAPSGKALLADGCYFIAFGLVDTPPSAHGTMRVTSRSGELSVSGDLYDFDPRGDPTPVGQRPPPGASVPIFPIPDYRHYLRALKIEPADGGFVLVFEAHLYLPQVFRALDMSDTPHWRLEATYTARMMRVAPPPGYPKPDMFFVGDVAYGDGTVFGRLQMGFVSSILRRAVIEIDREQLADPPLNNREGVSWKSIFGPLGWDVVTIESDSNITKKNTDPWNAADAQIVLQERRDSKNLDTEWRYHLLSVRLMKSSGSRMGHSYDRDDMAREGILVASHHVFEADDPKWGALRGRRAGDTVAFFRTAVHEMGHAMGLFHNTSGFCFMRPTEGIAETAPADKPFPTNIVWSFDPADEHRLRHHPDIMVRPGGVDLGVLPLT